MSKRTLYPIYSPEEEANVRPVLLALRDKGFKIRSREGSAKKGDAVLFFLSSNLRSEQSDAFFSCDAKKMEILPVNLDGSMPPEPVQNALMSRHSIYAERYDAEELAQKIADALKKPNPLPWIIAGAAAVLLLAIGAILLIRNLPKQTVAVDNPEPELTAEPTKLPIDPSTYGITEEDLKRITEVLIVGDRIEFLPNDRVEISEFTHRAGPEAVANNFRDENGESHWIDKETGEEIAFGHHDDLTILTMLPRLNRLCIACAEVKLPDLSGQKNLKLVLLYDVQTENLDALRNSNVETFLYAGSSVSDFTALNDCAGLVEADFEVFQPTEDTLRGFGPERLNYLKIESHQRQSVDLSALSGCQRLWRVELQGVSFRDLSFLSSSASALHELRIWDNSELISLTGLENCRFLNNVAISGCNRLADLNALKGQDSLEELRCNDAIFSDLSFLEGCDKLSYLETGHCSEIRSLAGLEKHNNLTELQIWGCERLNDISAINGLEKLATIAIVESFNLRDVSVVATLPVLTNLSLYGAGPDHVNYLEGIQRKNNFSFGVSSVADWSGLSAIKNYKYLNITNKNGSALQYLTDAKVKYFEFYNRTGIDDWGRTPFDLSKMPIVSEKITFHGVPSLEGMRDCGAIQIDLLDSPYLTSLNGLQNLTSFGKVGGVLRIENCPRLSDYAALEGKRLSSLTLRSLIALPDFSAFISGSYFLDTIVGLTDLNCFAGLSTLRKFSIELQNMDYLTDMSALYSLKNGYRLVVPAHLSAQAEELVRSGVFQIYEVYYPDSEWSAELPEVKLLSLEELDTLPPIVLGRVERLALYGDTLYDEDECWVGTDWSVNPIRHYLCRHDSDERILLDEKPGTLLNDFSKLSALTGLKSLTLQNQSFTSLEGIQYLESLENLDLSDCKKLTDASAAFTLQNLTLLDLRRTGIKSIDGIQNLFNLRNLSLEETKITSIEGLQNLYQLSWLGLNSTAVTSIEPLRDLKNLVSLTISYSNVRDLSPLADIDYSFAEQPDEGGYVRHFNLGVDGLQDRLKADQYANLSAIPYFDCLNVYNTRCTLWMDAVKDAGILELHAGGCSFTNESFRDLIESHPELTYIKVPGNGALTDLTPVLELENLRTIVVSDNMRQAIDSLGDGLAFELEIE